MIVHAETYLQSDGTWLSCIDSTYRTYGLDVTAEFAAESAGMIVRWAVHPEPVDVELHVVEAPPEAGEPIRHPGRPPGDRTWPQFWLVVPVTVRRVGKWEYVGKFEGFYSVQASCDTVESTLEATRGIFLKLHNRLSREVDEGDFVFEAIVEPDARNFDEDDDGGWSHIPGTTIRFRRHKKEESKE